MMAGSIPPDLVAKFVRQIGTCGTVVNSTLGKH
jgi:hypothetical protein